MAQEVFKVEGSIRETRGKGPARRTRATGMVPAILYGAKKESISLTVNSKQVAKILRSETGHSTKPRRHRRALKLPSALQKWHATGRKAAGELRLEIVVEPVALCLTEIIRRGQDR